MVVLMKILGTSSTGDTHVSLSRCGEGVLQVSLGGSVGYHSRTFKEVIIIAVYLEVRHESVHVVVGRFFGADVCMRLNDLGPVRALVVKVNK